MTRHTQVEVLLSERIINLPFGSQVHEEEHPDGHGLSDQITTDDVETCEVALLGGSGRKVPVAAVDCSNVHLGFGGGFSYEAARASIVTRSAAGDTHVTRIGPLVAKLPTDSVLSQGYILYALESFAQELAFDQVREGIVLLDGIALADGALHQVSSRAKVVGLSKTVPPQGVHGNGFGFPSEPFVMTKRHSNLCLVRLSRGGFVLRGRVWSRRSTDMPSVFSSLSASDASDMGYPDTLRLAHMFSKILPTEAISARIAITEKHGVRLSEPLDGRKLLLGSMWA